MILKGVLNINSGFPFVNLLYFYLLTKFANNGISGVFEHIINIKNTRL